MNAGKLLLTFSKAIKTSSVDLTQLVLQNDTVRRFGVSIVLNDSQYSVGLSAASVDLTILLSDTTFYFLKYYGIGYDLGYIYLSWTDTFVSDNSGNYLSPSYDSSVFGINVFPFLEYLTNLKKIVKTHQFN